MRPDGELLEDHELADLTQQLAQGFWYYWDPHPPEWWLEPRRAWCKYERDTVLLHLDGIDSAEMLKNALDSGAHDCAQGRQLLAAWRAVKGEYTPTSKAQWIDDTPLRRAIEHTQRGTEPWIIWTKHRAAGAKLRALGVPYYGGGTHPASERGRRTIACSIAAHGTGKNLQDWCRNLILTMPASAGPAEQLFARTHRPGQGAPKVFFDLYTITAYQQTVLDRVRHASELDGDAAGITYKITKGKWETHND